MNKPPRVIPGNYGKNKPPRNNSFGNIFEVDVLKILNSADNIPWEVTSLILEEIYSALKQSSDKGSPGSPWNKTDPHPASSHLLPQITSGEKANNGISSNSEIPSLKGVRLPWLSSPFFFQKFFNERWSVFLNLAMFFRHVWSSNPLFRHQPYSYESFDFWSDSRMIRQVFQIKTDFHGFGIFQKQMNPDPGEILPGSFLKTIDETIRKDFWFLSKARILATGYWKLFCGVTFLNLPNSFDFDQSFK